MGRKKRNGIKLFLLIFLIVLLLAVSVAMVIYGLLAGDKLTVGILVPLIVVTLISLARHIATSFGSAFFRGADFRLIAMIFGVMFLILFTAAVIYYYLISDHTLKPEVPSEMEPAVIEQPMVEEEIIPELEEVVEPVIEEEVEQKEMEEIDTLPAVPSLPQVDTYNEVLVPGIPSFSTLVEAELAEPSAPSFEMTISRVLEGTPAIPLFVEEGISRELREIAVPSSPVVSVESSSLYEEWLPPATTEEDDFWADFFIAGEDELVLEDGIYYMTLFINNNQVGTITTSIVDGSVSIATTELKDYIGDTITDEAESRIFSNAEEFISLDYLGDVGVETAFDSILYEIHLNFLVDDMPVQILSLKGNSSGYAYRPMSGGIDLEPATFVLSSRYQLSSRYRLYPFDDFLKNFSIGLSIGNTMRLGSIYGSFSYGLDYSYEKFNLSFGSYSFYHDFRDELIRLSWGNIGGNLLSTQGTPIGIKFEKSESYAPSGYKSKSHIEHMLVVEKESDVQILNEGKEIFRRTLYPGKYRLRDFVLYTGVNKIQIIVTPLDGSPVQEQEIELAYTSSLLAPGEIYYSGSLNTGRLVVPNNSSKYDGAVRIPWFDNKAIEYDIRNIALNGSLSAGLTKSLTMSIGSAFSNRVTESAWFNPSFIFATEFTHANILGTTRYNFNISEYPDSNGYWGLPVFFAKVGHQASMPWNLFSSLSTSAYYTSPDRLNSSSSHQFGLSLGLSGRLGIMGWSLSLSSNFHDFDIDTFNWNVSSGLSFSLGSNVWLSCSVGVNGVSNTKVDASGRISATFRFDKARVSTSSGFNDLSASLSVSGSNDSFYSSVYTNDFTEAKNYRITADYSHSGKLFNFSTGLSTDASLSHVSGNLSMSTSSVFADGLMAFSSYIPSNFLLLKQEGLLKDNDLSVGAVGSVTPQNIKTTFGVGLYTGLYGNSSSSLSVYSTNDDSFAGLTSFIINIPNSELMGYTFRLKGEAKYSASSVVLLPSGTPWINASSPLYSVDNEDGVLSLDITDNYMFTDLDGRFIISDLKPGLYGFDVEYNGLWYLYLIEIQDAEDRTNEIQTFSGDYTCDYIVPEQYSGVRALIFNSIMTSEEFWNMLFPSEGGLM